ncbi:hypothetical protein TCAL_16932 [Tigriopus californicus]|uniref:Uncharacterized protein n=1 Tax=Tigriopus californicus TaxID=6832 RepID=A0A553NPF2_TIGCA|nr:hypothetical protein TCAL_16932 [Tigriopus californicus]
MIPMSKLTAEILEKCNSDTRVDMESRMSGLDGLSYEQLKRKWVAFKGHLTRATNQFEAALELPFGIDQAHSKVMIKVSKAEEVLEAMEAK